MPPGERETLVISVAIHGSVLENWYRGRVTHVQTLADDGRSVRLAIQHFRPWILHDGLYGRFRLSLEGSRLVALTRLD